MLDGNKIFVGNISFSSTAEEIRAMFEAYGIQEFHMPINRDNQDCHRGIAFIRFNDALSAKRALEVNGQVVNGRTLRVEPARERPLRYQHSRRDDAVGD